MHQAHVSALEAKHAGLEARIVEESQRPLPDMATLARLKKEKLQGEGRNGRARRAALTRLRRRTRHQG